MALFIYNMNWESDASCQLHDALGGDTRKECFRLKKHYISLFFAQKPLFGPVWAGSQWRSRWRRLVAVSFSDGGDAATIVSAFFSKLFYSLEMIHILVTCVYIFTCYRYLPFVHRRQILSADAPRGVSKDSKTIYATPMELKFRRDFMLYLERLG